MFPSQDTAKAPLQVRPATRADQKPIADLLFAESHIHRHLDWRAPVDWLGYKPYWVIEEGGRITAALACPPDPEAIAWIRLFAFASHLSGEGAWELLWDSARTQLLESSGATAAAIAIQGWMEPILTHAGFEPAGHIVLLERDEQSRPNVRLPAGIKLRPMTFQDLPAIVDVDAAAFEPLWRNSLSALNEAYKLASCATVADDGSALVGYQLSTGGAFGTHLARLAVRPHMQKRGVGAALVGDLLAQMPDGVASRVTVNTQANNAASLALYYRLGFRRTGERFPVYRADVR
jgi:ribosomal protein S18 acetylase RimI-like enzyme